MRAILINIALCGITYVVGTGLGWLYAPGNDLFMYWAGVAYLALSIK